MATLISSITIGKILKQSGTGVPTHVAPVGSEFTDVSSGLLYINKNGTTDWRENIDDTNQSGGGGSFTGFTSFSSTTTGQGSVVATTVNDTLSFSGVNVDIFTDNTNKIITFSANTGGGGGSFTPISTFNSHTGDTTIHYTKGDINISELGSSAHTHTVSEITDYFDTFVTGGTYSSDTITFTNNSGNTFQVTGITSSSDTLYSADGSTGENRNVFTDTYKLTFSAGTVGEGADAGVVFDASSYSGIQESVLRTIGPGGQNLSINEQGFIESLNDGTSYVRFTNRGGTLGLSINSTASNYGGTDFSFANSLTNTSKIFMYFGGTAVDQQWRKSGTIDHWIRTNDTAAAAHFFRTGFSGNKFIVGGSAIVGSEDISLQGETLMTGKLEMNTTSDGILIPRLTTVQMNAIVTPDTNLFVFNTDEGGIYRYDGSAWVALLDSAPNFANSDLTFTTGRTHNLGGYELTINSSGATQLLNIQNDGTFSVGLNAQSDDNTSVSIGQGASTLGQTQNTALGWLADASGYRGTAIGSNSEASGNASIGIGVVAEATQQQSIAIGHLTYSTATTAIKIGSGTASGGASVGIGNTTNVSGSNSVAIGSLQTNDIAESIMIGTGEINAPKFFIDTSGNNVISRGHRIEDGVNFDLTTGHTVTYLRAGIESGINTGGIQLWAEHQTLNQTTSTVGTATGTQGTYTLTLPTGADQTNIGLGTVLRIQGSTATETIFATIVGISGDILTLDTELPTNGFAPWNVNTTTTSASTVVIAEDFTLKSKDDKGNVTDILSGGGEINTASNVGGGEGLFSGKSGVDLQFKSLTSTGGTVTITSTGATVNLESSGGSTGLDDQVKIFNWFMTIA